ncbi:hypothetical protein IWX90DRAFT_261191 [Phyllosticta citrichinensis]|uniref:Uncharacterized protein n=1 Tax=Phyllosticta citrichinensis TaxID=1130410 RepID=A0ABR1XSM2_9PEZI
MAELGRSARVRLRRGAGRISGRGGDAEGGAAEGGSKEQRGGRVKKRWSTVWSSRGAVECAVVGLAWRRWLGVRVVWCGSERGVAEPPAVQPGQLPTSSYTSLSALLQLHHHHLLHHQPAPSPLEYGFLRFTALASTPYQQPSKPIHHGSGGLARSSEPNLPPSPLIFMLVPRHSGRRSWLSTLSVCTTKLRHWMPASINESRPDVETLQHALFSFPYFGLPPSLWVGLRVDSSIFAHRNRIFP